NDRGRRRPPLARLPRERRGAGGPMSEQRLVLNPLPGSSGRAVTGAAETDSRSALIAILQLAFSGERAAGYAYRGHWRSVHDPEERRRIREIEDEEWHHRQLVGELLQKLGAAPVRLREWRALMIGRVLGALCHVAGWYAP